MLHSIFVNTFKQFVYLRRFPSRLTSVAQLCSTINAYDRYQNPTLFISKSVWHKWFYINTEMTRKIISKTSAFDWFIKYKRENSLVAKNTAQYVIRLNSQLFRNIDRLIEIFHHCSCKGYMNGSLYTSDVVALLHNNPVYSFRSWKLRCLSRVTSTR